MGQLEADVPEQDAAVCPLSVIILPADYMWLHEAGAGETFMHLAGYHHPLSPRYGYAGHLGQNYAPISGLATKVPAPFDPSGWAHSGAVDQDTVLNPDTRPFRAAGVSAPGLQAHLQRHDEQPIN
ncbi:hypothetical protein N7462_002708 [Penicillium macrosclerotiorum]|uniref:uncharacterized protein n=1 Tax=Penicillium macrosclerotiorum TaxID=303699 RepID=UPI0025482664|nr:uncharacterized protein N7462_002708 [Penicillium macrosclerotiorum]KAJ5693285.1 hypothetical protein N7462_002708 [Penicillium macrosclerotiorum]